MKRCPKCSQNYSDDSLNFCLADGTALVFPINNSEETVVMNPLAPPLVDDSFVLPSNEWPTQISGRRQQQHYSTPPVVTVSPSKWVFPLIGILLGLLIVFGFFAFFRETPSEKSVVTQKNTEVGEPDKNIESRRRAQDAITPTPPPSPLPPDPMSYPVVTVNSPRDGFLALRSEPCIGVCGTTLLKIPHGTRLRLGTCKDNIEIADRRRGRWCYTSYGGYTGWIFDGFVTR